MVSPKTNEIVERIVATTTYFLPNIGVDLDTQQDEEEVRKLMNILKGDYSEYIAGILIARVIYAFAKRMKIPSAELWKVILDSNIMDPNGTPGE